MSLRYYSLRFRTQEFIELECEELATIDALREKADKEDSALPTSPFLPNGRPGNNPIKLIIDLLKNEGVFESDFLITVQFGVANFLQGTRELLIFLTCDI
jgi:hypothetical protein